MKDQKPKQSRLYALVSHPLFNIAITLLIVFNTTLMAIYTHDEQVDLTVFRSETNVLFDVIFTLELLLKLLGFGAR